MPSSPSSPEELLRSIERTREELALTVDTIAGRLDPRAAAKRGVGKVRSSVTEMFDGARGRRSRQPELVEPGFEETAIGRGTADGRGGGPRRPSASSAIEAAAGTAREAVGSVGSAARQVPTPAIAAALAALLAFAAIIAARSRSRSQSETRSETRGRSRRPAGKPRH